MGVGYGSFQRNHFSEQRVKNPSQSSISTVIEWSQNGVKAFTPETKKVHSASSLSELGQITQDSGPTTIAVSRRSIFVKPVRVPNSGESEIRQILRIQLDQLFPVQQGELAYDLWLTSNVNAEGRLAVICGIKTDILRTIEAQANEASIRSVRILPVSLGSAIIAKNLGQKNAVVIESTGDGLAIDVICDSELRYSRVAPFIVGQSSVKIEIDRTLSIAGADSCPIIGAGGTHFQEAELHSEIGSLAALGSPQAHTLHVNLEPPEAAEERRNKAINQRMRLGTLLAIGAVAFWGLLIYDWTYSASKRADFLRPFEEKVEKLETKKKLVDSTQSKASAALTELNLGIAPAQKFSDVLNVVGSNAPATVWLNGVTLERGKNLSLRGNALSNEGVASLVKNLANQSRFRDVKMGYANNGLIDATPIVQFSVTAHVVGNLPLKEADSNKRTK